MNRIAEAYPKLNKLPIRYPINVTGWFVAGPNDSREQ
jgi:hypothetical protein